MNINDLANKFYNDGEYLKVIELAKHNQNIPDVLFYAGLSYDCINEKLTALDFFRKALSIQSDHKLSLRALGWGSSDSVEQLEALEKLAHSNNAEADDMSLMAEIYCQHTRLNDAHYWYKKSLEAMPFNSLSLLGLADVYVRLAIKYLQDAEDSKDIDLSMQMSSDRFSEDALRFIYENVINRNTEDDALDLSLIKEKEDNTLEYYSNLP